MEKIEKFRTVCRSCHSGCSVIAHVKNDRVIKVDSDPESPISYGKRHPNITFNNVYKEFNPIFFYYIRTINL